MAGAAAESDGIATLDDAKGPTMRDALEAVYGRDRPWPGRLFRPIISPRTYLRAIHLLAMFPLGIAYFVSLVVAFAVGGALIWTIVGPVILLATLYLTRWPGDIEAWLVRRVALIELRRPPTAIERGLSFRTQVWTRLIDPTTWTGLVYLFVQFPIGIAMFVRLVVIGTVSGALITAPLLLWLDVTNIGLLLVGAGVNEIHLGVTVMDRPFEALFLVPIGVAVLFAGIHLVNIASALHASWARLMLGSRAQRVPSVAPTPEGTSPPEPPPVPEGGQPVAMQPPSPTVPELDASEGTTPGSVGATRIAELTPREQEVLQLIARGYSNAEIAGGVRDQRGHGEDSREAAAGQAGAARPHAGGRLCV
jgi:hypothetical protein